MSENPTIAAEEKEELKLHGLLAEFDNVDDLLRACEAVRDAGYRKWDAHTPFPVHGIEEKMGVRPTVLPWIVLVGGMTGMGLAVLMQWWMNAVDYPFLVSGKPYFSFPANVPIMFELTVLFSAITAFLCALALSMLPQFYHPLFRSERFLRATDDRFFISIDEADPKFQRDATAALLSEYSPHPVEEVFDAKEHAPIPKWLIQAGIVAVVFTFIPLLVIAKARYTKTDKPPLHVVWDMDWQKKVKAQNASMFPFFEDGRGSRPQVPGTVAVGQFYEDEQVPYMEGRVLDPSTVSNENGFVEEIPVPKDEITWRMRRGQERFGIYCAPCHGLAGDGAGIVNARATLLQEAGHASGWVNPASFHTEDLRNRPVGDLFETITNGKNTMPAYRSQIPVDDRWNIILYIKALQRSQWATVDDAPGERRADIERMIREAPEETEEGN